MNLYINLRPVGSDPGSSLILLSKGSLLEGRQAGAPQLDKTEPGGGEEIWFLSTAVRRMKTQLGESVCG